MTDETGLRNELQELERAWSQITAIPETPRSMLNVLEYSLGSQRKAEVYVNRLLRYFLDPTEPHGMDDELLRRFLEELPAGCEFNEDTYDLSEVRVAEQVPISSSDDERDGTGSAAPGYVDLVVAAPNEWVLITELKFRAGENNLRGDGLSQTESYFRATSIGDSYIDEYAAGQYYLYVHPETEPPANEPRFTDWTWKALTTNVLEPFVATNAPRYPQRTIVQLREMTDDIKEITGMSDHQANEQQKVELYLKHYDAITDVAQTFDEHWEDFTTEWPVRLEERLLENGWTDLDQWTFRAKDSDWAHLFKWGWWREINTLDPITARDPQYNDIRFSFIHRLEANRTQAISEKTLVFYFRNCGSNDTAFRDCFNQRFADRREEIQRTLPDTAELTGQQRNLIEATYDIRVEAYDDFFEAYIAALQRAFVDHALENESLLAIIDEICTGSIEDYYG